MTPVARGVAATHEVRHDRNVGEAERFAELSMEVARPFDDVRDVDGDSRPSARSRAVSSAARSSVGLCP